MEFRAMHACNVFVLRPTCKNRQACIALFCTSDSPCNRFSTSAASSSELDQLLLLAIAITMAVRQRPGPTTAFHNDALERSEQQATKRGTTALSSSAPADLCSEQQATREAIKLLRTGSANARSNGDHAHRCSEQQRLSRPGISQCFMD